MNANDNRRLSISRTHSGLKVCLKFGGKFRSLRTEAEGMIEDILKEMLRLDISEKAWREGSFRLTLAWNPERKPIDK